MNETEEIKARLPIEQVVGRHVQLKKMGRVYKGLCPFHNEKTPSFTVNPERAIYKCFGCGEGGDIFDFTMKIEGTTFPEALQVLAEQAGVTLENKQTNQENKGPSRSRLFQLNTYINKVWQTVLEQHPKADVARQYLRGRGLTPESIKDFQIGFAPPGEASTLTLRKAGYSQAEISAAGEPGKFRNRITFPLTDITGRIVGFTGRQLEEGHGPKYWNSPETPLFSKTRTVYALHLAKQAIAEQDLAVLAEGQMDVIMLHQAGYNNAVASSGTALTTSQLQLIARFSPNIAFAYDNDGAGIEATKRGIELCLESELNPYVIVTPGGKDPAECLQSDLTAWQQAYENRLPFMQWLLNEALKDGSELTPVRKKEIAKVLLPWIKRIKDPVEQDDWIRQLASRLLTNESSLRLALERARGNSTTTTSSQPTAPEPNASRTPAQEQAELATSLLLSFPEHVGQLHEYLKDIAEVPSTPFLTLSLPLLREKKPLTSLPDQVQKEIGMEITDRMRTYEQVELSSTDALTEILLLLARMRSENKTKIKEDLALQISQAQAQGDKAKVHALFAELKNLL